MYTNVFRSQRKLNEVGAHFCTRATGGTNDDGKNERDILGLVTLDFVRNLEISRQSPEQRKGFETPPLEKNFRASRERSESAY
jgi:hypothetical protein